MVTPSSRENPQSILAEVMERCRLPEEERRIYIQRMSHALLCEAAEVRRLLCDPDNEAKAKEP